MIMKNGYVSAIKKRRSTRIYHKKHISAEKQEKIKNFCDNQKSMFGAKIRIEIVEKQAQQRKLATYGVINNAQTFLVGIMDRSFYAEEAIGYAMEEAILYTTSLGIATCWLGGTFNKGAFADAVELRKSECLPVVSPIGLFGSKNPLKNMIDKSLIQPHRRKAFEELFYSGDFRTPLTKKMAGDYSRPLEMVRLAPSSMNSQPWRVLVEGSAVHFYRILPRTLNRIDMGIALCHFDKATKERKLSGHFEYVDRALDKTPANGFYTMSWIKD